MTAPAEDFDDSDIEDEDMLDVAPALLDGKAILETLTRHKAEMAARVPIPIVSEHDAVGWRTSHSMAVLFSVFVTLLSFSVGSNTRSCIIREFESHAGDNLPCNPWWA